MMKIILRLAHLFDNKKDRAYVSEAGKFMREFDKNNPQKSESQKKEILKHRNLYTRKAKKETSFLDG
jgi:hypothetical protein